MTDVGWGVDRRHIDTASACTAGGSVRRQGPPANSPVRRTCGLAWPGQRRPASALVPTLIHC